MNVVSFYAPRPDHPYFMDYRPLLALLRESCDRYGHKHLALTDDPTLDDGYVVPDLPHNLMLAFLTAQHAYLQRETEPTLLTGADCVLAQDPAVFAGLCGDADILVTIGPFEDCPLNMGAIYIPDPQKAAPVWADAITRCKGEWGDDQRAFLAALMASEGIKVVDAPVDPYNLAPEYPGDDCRRGVVLHFRGPRKAWMAAYCKDWLGIGGGVQVKALPNTDDETAIAQIKANLARGYPELQPVVAHAGTAVLVGSGPSARDDVARIRALRDGGATLFGMNGSVKWLNMEDMQPDFGVMIDMREGNTRFLMLPKTAWLIASHCHPAVLEAASTLSSDLRVFHYGAEAMRPHLPSGAMLIGGGPTVGMTAMVVAFALGFRRLELFGYDSSFRGDETHLLQQPINDAESRLLEVWAGRQKFITNIGMFAQAEAFPQVVERLQEADPEIQIAVHGQGLLPTIAHSMVAQPAIAA